jgi:hypothetical protein
MSEITKEALSKEIVSYKVRIEQKKKIINQLIEDSNRYHDEIQDEKQSLANAERILEALKK